MGEETEVRNFFYRLKDSLTASLNRALEDYNALRPCVDRMEQQNTSYRGALTEGVTATVTNRVNGAYALYKTPLAFYKAAFSGFQWGQYFIYNNNLNGDVYHAGIDVLRNTNPSLRGLATFTATGLYLANGGMREIENNLRKRYEQQRNTLAVSTIASMGVTGVFKWVSNAVKVEWKRISVRSAMRGWQVTGMVAFCYGLSRLNEAMEGSGHFGMYFKQRRDNYLMTYPTPGLGEFKDAAEGPVIEGGRKGAEKGKGGRERGSED